MVRDYKLFLDDIIESCELLEQYIKNVNEEEFKVNTQLQDSVFRRLEIIGEATKNLPPLLKSKYPKIPWKSMAGMRDVLIHRYHGIHLEDTWDVATKDAPRIKKQIQKIRADLKK